MVRGVPDWMMRIGFNALGMATSEAGINVYNQRYGATLGASSQATATWINLSTGYEAQLLGCYFSCDSLKGDVTFELKDATNNLTLWKTLDPRAPIVDLHNYPIPAATNIVYDVTNNNAYTSADIAAGLWYLVRKVVT